MPDAASERALTDAGMSDNQINALLGAGCAILPAFTVSLEGGLSVVGYVPESLNYVSRQIGDFSPELQSDWRAQRENIMRHERGHVYFNSGGYNDVFAASVLGQQMAADFPNVQRSQMVRAGLREVSYVDELVGDASLICEAAADGQNPLQTRVFLNWREREAEASVAYRNNDVLTPAFISTLQTACQPLGPNARGQDIMRTTARTLLQGPWNFLIK